jgi:hypothetical protein
LPSVLEEHDSSFGEADAGRAAQEKSRAELFLQRFDLQSDRGLTQIESFAGLAEAQVFGDCSKDFEAKVFEH